MLEISIIKCLTDNYSYLIKDKKTNLIGVVDPSEFKPIDEEINKKYKKLDFILNTHHHNDHVGGNLDLKKKYKSKIICSAYGESKTPGADQKKRMVSHLFLEIQFLKFYMYQVTLSTIFLSLAMKLK
tara:strand:+ start:1614 stop:1994 length:381 start_codon:yes stop_codon:yes gene_type:complete